MKKKLEELAEANWPEIYTFFGSCDTFHPGPVCHASDKNQPLAFKLLQKLIDRQDAFSGFKNGTKNPDSPMTVAYCFWGLRLTAGKALNEIREEYSENSEEIPVRLGSFAYTKGLNEILDEK